MLERVNGIYNVLNLQIIDREKVPILDIIRLDADTWGRLDLIVNSYYKSSDVKGIDYMQIFLDWNSINDVFELEVGRLLEIPDIIYYLLHYSSNTNIFNTDDVPGVISPSLTNKFSSKFSKPNNTSANTKLEITQTPAVYNPNTGILTL